MVIYLITAGFIVMDLITGLLKAVKAQGYKSTKMREGLFHKCGSILCILLGVMVDYAQGYYDLGITIPVALSICTYITLMEIGSIVENIGEINPLLLPGKIRAIMNITTDKGE